MKIIILLILTLLLTSCNKKESTNTEPLVTCKTVIDIGGCSSSALCGVLFDDKTTAKAYYPVKNIQMCKIDGKGIYISHYRHEEEAYRMYNELTGKKHLKEE